MIIITIMVIVGIGSGWARIRSGGFGSDRHESDRGPYESDGSYESDRGKRIACMKMDRIRANRQSDRRGSRIGSRIFHFPSSYVCQRGARKQRPLSWVRHVLSLARGASSKFWAQVTTLSVIPARHDAGARSVLENLGASDDPLGEDART